MNSSQTQRPPAQPRSTTEADATSVDGHSGGAGKNGHDEMSHKKAGSTTGAGGGKKQERQN